MPKELCKGKDTELWLTRSKCLIVTLPQGYLPVTSINSRKFIKKKKKIPNKLQGMLCIIFEVSPMKVYNKDNTEAVLKT